MLRLLIVGLLVVNLMLLSCCIAKDNSTINIGTYLGKRDQVK